MRERMKNKNDHIPLVIVSREMLKKKKFNKHAKSGLFLMSHMQIWSSGGSNNVHGDFKC